MIGLVEAAAAFALTRRVSRPGLGRARFEAWQRRALRRWLDRSLPRVAAYERAPMRLSDLPVTDKATLKAEFHRYNVPGLTAEEVSAAIARDARIGPFTVGASTGTSGNRGLFVISERERFRWLGSLLAKSMADLLWRSQRVAVAMPQSTRLYDAARRTGRIDLRIFDLADAPEAWTAGIAAFDPTVLVAPPKVLRHLAEARVPIAPHRVFSAAEALDPVDRTPIEAAFGPLEQIYMATEGLLGVSCRHGRLHLAEDSMAFEFEPAGDGLVTPLVTSFRRDTQILARYRMNDLVRLDDAACPCGSPLRVAMEVVGRMDDVFRFGPDGLVTPDVLRNAVLGADRRIGDFRLVQTGPADMTLTLPPEAPPEAMDAARAALVALLARRGLAVALTCERRELPLDVARKLRRVERRWRS